MSEEVLVPYGTDRDDTATTLLAAADTLAMDPGVVRTGSQEGFLVPHEVAVEAGYVTEPAP